MRAKDLTHQLITFSMGGAPIKKTTDIVELIKGSVSFALRGSNIRCEFFISDALRPVEVDERQINQVINNLIINANQAMPKGGMINVGIENISAGAQDILPLREGKYVKVSISDQGVGISEEHLKNIFDPYFTTKQKSSGLGLTTSYSIIKNHNGLITVESEIGVGTTFHIYLPVSVKEIMIKKEEKLSTAGKGKILIMDDEEIVKHVIGEMLKSVGYEVEFAEDGAKAICYTRRKKKLKNPLMQSSWT